MKNVLIGAFAAEEIREAHGKSQPGVRVRCCCP